MTFSVYGYSNDVVNMLEALCEAGIGVVCDESERLLRMAQESDCVGITPGANKHAHNEKIGNEIRPPHIDDGITAEEIDDIIAATEWEPQKQVKPINNGKQ